MNLIRLLCFLCALLIIFSPQPIDAAQKKPNVKSAGGVTDVSATRPTGTLL
jgi:hypothetical protein